MMRKPRFLVFLFLLMFFSGLHTGAQTPVGNAWVQQHAGQDFWKFPVIQNGIYRIDSLTLSQAGFFSVAGFDPRKIQLFRNGMEVPVYVFGEDDGVFNQGDFIEFFGRRNDASMDRSLFADTAWMVNSAFSLFTDTSYYFLTIGTTLQNKRLTLEQAVDFTNYLPAENYFLAKVSFEPAGTYAGGALMGEDYSKDTRYHDGEGWVDFPFGIDFNLTNPREVNLQTQGIYQQGPPATLSYSLVGRSKYNFKYPVYPGKNHHVKIFIDGNSTPLDDFTYPGYAVYRNSVQIPAANLSTSFHTKFLFTGVDDMSSIPSLDATRTDRNSIGRIDLTFPHGMNFGNNTDKWMTIPDHLSKTKSYFSFTNFNNLSGEAILYDLTNNRRIKVVTTSGTHQVLVPNSLPGNPAAKECYLTSEGKVMMINQLTPLSTGLRFQDFFADFQQNQYDYLIITHPSLHYESDQYANYRKTGGYPQLYNPVVVDIEALYEQFSWGIRNHPLAIENFLRFLYQNGLMPQYTFLIGKGYSSIYARKDTITFKGSLIPGWGYPATDNEYINRLSTNHLNDFAIGRLAAATPIEVAQYLEKVMQYEDTLRLRNEMWMKRVIHLGGGSSPGEQTIIKNKLKDWEGVIEDPSFGGDVTTILKTSSEPIEIIKSKQLKDLINGGVRVMTFYGHGSANGFDITIDEVNSYENEGRYPLVIVNSCYSGDLFNKLYTKSEEFVLTAKKGAIAFVGGANYSSIPVLNEINDTLYHHLSQASYGATVGQLMRTSLRQLKNTQNSFFHLTAYQQSTLHGDPAMVVSVQDKPDYRMAPPQIFFSPDNVTNEIDSFTVHMISRNPGKAVPDTFAVRITRVFPDKTTEDTLLYFPGTHYQDTFDHRVAVKGSMGLGINVFRVELDALYEIQESDESNNMAEVPLYIKSAGLIPVFPYEFAVIPDNSVQLFASTTDPFSPQKTYHFQLSANASFTPLISSHTMKGSGGILSWQPPITLADSMVYFWRVAVDSADHPEGIFDWRKSSFRYIDGQRGWSQARFDQFTANDYQYISIDTSGNSFHFIDDYKGLTVQTGVYPHLQANQHFYSLNGTILHQSAAIISQGMPGGFVMAAFDTLDGNPIKALNNSSTMTGNWGNLQDPNSTKNAFEYPTHTAQWQDNLRAFFDSIPTGYYVLAYSIKNHDAPNFPEPLYQAFESIGSSLIRTLPANTPYAIFGRKGATIGDPEWVLEGTLPAVTDTLRMDYAITTRWHTGNTVSSLIGPAKQWNSAYWKQIPFSSDPSVTDTVRYSILGVDIFGNTVAFPALTNLPDVPGSILQLDQVIDAADYPYLRLKAEMRDHTYHTPGQMESWMVLYTPVGETALDPVSAFAFYKDSVQQGDSIYFKMATRNISPYDMDSILVNCWVRDGERKIHHSVFKRYRPHPGGDTLLIDSIGFNTSAMAPGVSTLWIEVNPVNLQTQAYDQPEQTHVNNIGEKFFLIYPDQQNPLLDVTFDGIRILDGDLVSARPAIEIMLNDENRFFLMDEPEDTALFRIYLKYPSETE
ncbi:MAG: C25 family cysteine peptidase, partial [Bacteroidales bacterium]